MMALLALLLSGAPALPALPGEQPVDPYTISDANAGARPYRDDDLFRAFGGHDGIARIVDTTIVMSEADARIADIFKNHDLVRLRRTLAEQFCYLLGGGCAYTGRDMTASHKDMGLQTADFNALVENLQAAMDKEGVGFHAQNRLLAKLAPMKRVMVER